MIRQARTGDTLLAKSREMTSRTQTLPWWLEIEGVKTTENKIHGSVGMYTGHGQFFAFRVITVKKRVYEKINIFIEAT
jgi:hypothetical protein